MNDAQRKILTGAAFAVGVFAGFFTLAVLNSPSQSDDRQALTSFAVSFAAFVVGFYLRAGELN